MTHTNVLNRQVETFNSDTGEITTAVQTIISKSEVLPSDEFIKVSKYLNVIFAFFEIPLRLVPISLLIAQRMDMKTNVVTLLKADKEQIADMLDVSLDRVNKLIKDCKDHDIIRPQTRGKYLVNAYLFSTGSLAQTRKLQAQFDFTKDKIEVDGKVKDLITGEKVQRALTNYKEVETRKSKAIEIPGQMSIEDLETPEG